MNPSVKNASTPVACTPSFTDADVPEGYSDRGNLGKQYYEGFLKSSLGESDSVQTENRDTITASVKLGVQATGVLAFLTLGFMASNGLL